MTIPANLHYTKEHEWIKLDGNIATVGITDFAQSELGDIVFVEIETVGKNLAADEIFGSIEAVKTVSDLFLPVSGKVLEVNNIVVKSPEKVNEDAYGDGWLIKMEVANLAEINHLLDAAAYGALIGM
jgi:glycine cleavage system H protein